MLGCFSHIPLFVTPGMAAHQAALSTEFSRQEYRRGLPRPPLRDLPNLLKPAPLMSPSLVGGFFTTSAIWEVFQIPQQAPAKPSLPIKKLEDPQNIPTLDHRLWSKFSLQFRSVQLMNGWLSPPSHRRQCDSCGETPASDTTHGPAGTPGHDLPGSTRPPFTPPTRTTTLIHHLNRTEEEEEERGAAKRLPGQQV